VQARLAAYAGVFLSVVVAALCGQSLDQRQRQVRAARVVQLDDARASLALPRTVAQLAEDGVRARIEQLSGVEGAPLLSTQRWEAAEPIMVDGVDVSDMFTQEFVLRRSVRSSYRFKSATIDAIWERPHSFLDLGVALTANGALVVRFSKGEVRSFFRAHSGRLIPHEVASGERVGACNRFEVALVGDDRVQVVCEGERVLEVHYPTPAQGRVFLASNLTAGELLALRVYGTDGEQPSEDPA
jgi:hypothetical protein